ncbi:MAG: zf-TFIIB domain-containing protein [Planctomycetota bacterium]
MQCPKCKAEMTAIDIDGTEVDRCETCGGMWFDLGEKEALKASDHEDAGRFDIGSPAIGERHNAIRDYDCPRCGAQMIKLAHHEQRHIEYERCATCGGAFLDAGEFDDLRDLTPNERARRLFPRLFG